MKSVCVCVDCVCEKKEGDKRVTMDHLGKLQATDEWKKWILLWRTCQCKHLDCMWTLLYAAAYTAYSVLIPHSHTCHHYSKDRLSFWGSGSSGHIKAAADLMGQRRPLWMSESQNRGWNGSNRGTNILTDRDKEANDPIHSGPSVAERVSFKPAWGCWMDIWHLIYMLTHNNWVWTRCFTYKQKLELNWAAYYMSHHSELSHIYQMWVFECVNSAYLLQLLRWASLYCLEKWSW